MTRFRAFIIIGDSDVGCWQICKQTMAVPMCMHNGFSTRRMEQMIMMSLCDITRISHAEKGREL